MRILPPDDHATRVMQSPLDGVERYRHLTDRALVGEIVRRGICGSRDDIDLKALAPEWRPQVLRTVLAFHDKYPNGFWLPGGIRALHFGNGNSPKQTMAFYARGERSITINADVYSKKEVKRAHWRGNFDGALNHLAGTIFHECWHCVQDAYTPAMREFIADKLIQATSDGRMAFPLAHQDLRREIIETVRGYAVTQPHEFEAEVMRVHAQGAPTAMSYGLVSAAEALFGPAGDASVLDRVKALVAEEARRAAAGELTPYVPTPKTQVDVGVMGELYEAPSYSAYGTSDYIVRYIETEDGNLYRLAGSTLINATASFDERAIVSCEIPEGLRSAIVFNVGEPMWFRGQRTDDALPEGFATAPVQRVVEVPRGVYHTTESDLVEQTRGRRTDLVRRTEQILAAADPTSIGAAVAESGISMELVDRAWSMGPPEFSRCTEPAEGALRVADLNDRAFDATAVAIAANGDQVAISSGRYGRCSLVAIVREGGTRSLRYFNTTTESTPELRVGEVLACRNAEGEEFSFGPVARIVIAERTPVKFEALRQMQPQADRDAAAVAPPWASASASLAR